MSWFGLWSVIVAFPGQTHWFSDLDTNCLTLMVFMQEFFKNNDFENRSMQNNPAFKELRFRLLC